MVTFRRDHFLLSFILNLFFLSLQPTESFASIPLRLRVCGVNFVINLFINRIFMKSFLSVILLLALFSCKTTQNVIQKPMKFADNPVVAHRGAWKAMGYPENSIASLKHAIELGCSGSEFDVRMTSDDSLIVNHDPKYNGLDIEKSTYADLIKFKMDNGEKLPTLREYLLAGMQDNTATRLVLEIKPSESGKERGLIITEKTVKMVERMNAKPWVVYISFGYDILLKIKQMNPQANTQFLNATKTPEQLKTDGVDGADYHYNAFKKNPDWIASSKSLGRTLNAWTANDIVDIDRLLNQKFDYITTNEPELVFDRITNPLRTTHQLVWSDEFNYSGLPDSAKWNFVVGGKGYGNNEKQFYTDADTDNALVKNGVLTITARKEKMGDNEYTSARLNTAEKAEWKYGHYEIRAKLPQGRGIWPAIWMLGKNRKEAGWPACGEIDIMEHVGYDPDTVVFTVHTKAYNHVKGTQKSGATKVTNLYDDFHIYGIDWTAEKMDFLFDGKVQFTFRNENKTTAEWPFDQPFFMILNVAVGGNWGGKKGIDDSIFPQKMEVDYVRVYQVKEKM